MQRAGREGKGIDRRLGARPHVDFANIVVDVLPDIADMKMYHKRCACEADTKTCALPSQKSRGPWSAWVTRTNLVRGLL